MWFLYLWGFGLRVVICSGGTGGHMFPACALFSALKNKHDVFLVTDARGVVYCDNLRRSMVVVIETIRRSGGICDLGKSIRTFFSLLRLWNRNPPDIIIGFGGLFTVVPLLAAAILGSKVVLYEQNSVAGKANKLLSPLARMKLSFFDISGSWQRVLSPVREDFLRLSNVPYCCDPDSSIKIVVIGGSQGARSFSQIIPDAILRLDEAKRQKLEIIQQVKHEEQEQLEKFYTTIGVKFTGKHFLHNIAEIMASVQLVICRSGASTLAELSTLGRPAILIPYPNATDNHQFLNAIDYVNKNAAWLVEEKNDAAEKISSILEKVLGDRELLKSAASNMINKNMANANDLFVEILEDIART
jgi:UDP-N-acetylglucosamine--N-acetylmuramyl-(pentapeptide) pyrophosphoryl-undecaprenol N-acetylglucosamine transferase